MIGAICGRLVITSGAMLMQRSAATGKAPAKRLFINRLCVTHLFVKYLC